MKLGYYLLTIEVLDHWFNSKKTITYYHRTKGSALGRVNRYKKLGAGIEVLNYSIKRV